MRWPANWRLFSVMRTELPENVIPLRPLPLTLQWLTQTAFISWVPGAWYCILMPSTAQPWISHPSMLTLLTLPEWPP